ncbi:MAG: low molecular weight protein arginine phosphatase [bacterium]|nr:low molecular weight protein arginine phosphatase [bacterium]MDD5354669.1 low molecular weight protein arginine phosphatase [bacterium]MDD5755799.1 low molecular weight protein arginine phosphatase [bacterium]
MYKKILFVCTGNVCRSAMAEAMCKKMLKNLGLKGIKVWSRGLAGSRMLRVPDEVVQLMAEESCRLDLDIHVSAPLTVRDLSRADLVLVMEDYHKEKIVADFPAVADKVFLLKQFAGAGDGDVEDPIGMEEKDYRACKDEIKGYLQTLIIKLQEQRS